MNMHELTKIRLITNLSRISELSNFQIENPFFSGIKTIITSLPWPGAPTYI